MLNFYEVVNFGPEMRNLVVTTPTVAKLTSLVEHVERYRLVTSFDHAHFRFGRWAGLEEKRLDADISGTGRDIDARFSAYGSARRSLKSAQPRSTIWGPAPENRKFL